MSDNAPSSNEAMRVSVAATDPIRAGLEEDEARALREAAETASGPISRLASEYDRTSDHLLGFVLNMSYDEVTIVTCDAWKRKCGGVPKNSFVIVKLNPAIGGLTPAELPPQPYVILVRILDSASVPLSDEVQQTVFQIHKVQADLDPITNANLQWGGLKASILGTYYDDDARIDFGNDIDSYVSPHFYEVYVPKAHHLELLVNSFVAAEGPMTIGKLRYTETVTASDPVEVPVKVAPHDFVANRTALFGKTRMGKSNIIKVIADMMMRSPETLGQVIFDLNGEYAYRNEQDETSLFELHRAECARYGLRPRTVDEDAEPPKPLKVNFFKQVVLGHSVIRDLWDAEHKQRPNYFLPFLEWEPCDEADLDERFDQQGDKQRYLRAQGMYFAALAKAGYEHENPDVKLVLNQAIKQELAANAQLAQAARMKPNANPPELSDTQPLRMAIEVYKALYQLHSRKKDDASLFPVGSSGLPYFEPIHVALLKAIGDTGVSGTIYLMPFRQYHGKEGGHVADEIGELVDAGKTVILDLGNANEVVARFYSEMIAKAVFRRQIDKFASSELGDHSVLFYFEEAHNLFRHDDRDLTSIYNRLAKEGAKFRIGLVYATQSMTTLSPDLLKNTENFFIAHLSDDREISELTKRYEFKNIGLDVQRSRTKGYVRMITLSHRYALPVQVEKFSREMVQAMESQDLPSAE